ncbi:hypothetical protein ACFL9U_08925 [Thermodesulfobacteriota bacterium]
MKNNTVRIFMVLMALLVVTAVPAGARIKLVSLPERGATLIRLDNPQATLVEEERILTLQKGINRVDFSWKGVSIDADSIRLAMLSHPGQVFLLNVSYPPNEAALVWEISSEGAWEEKVRVSYLLAGIDRLIAYKAFADKGEHRVLLKSRLILRNFSGEDFREAETLLDIGGRFNIGISHEETKQLRLFEKKDVPLTKVWKFDAGIQPWDPRKLAQNVGIPVFYRIENNNKNRLGEFSLPQGKVRVYQEDGHGGTIFLGEDNIEFVPVGEKADILIGNSRDIVVTQHQMQNKKINVRRNKKNEVVLHDTDEIIKAEIENFKNQPAVLTLIEHIPGQWEMKKCSTEYTLKDAFTLVFEIALPPQGKKELSMHYFRRNIR